MCTFILNNCTNACIFQSVTLGDEEASRRGVQKTVLERKGPSTFSCGVEIISKTELQVHPSLEATVDAILSGAFFLFKGKRNTKKRKILPILFIFQIKNLLNLSLWFDLLLLFLQVDSHILK